MKEILLTVIAVSVCWYVFYDRSEKKRFNELKLKSDTITLLKQEKFIKDSLMMDLEDLLLNEKEAARIKKIYFNR